MPDGQVGSRMGLLGSGGAGRLKITRRATSTRGRQSARRIGSATSRRRWPPPVLPEFAVHRTVNKCAGAGRPSVRGSGGLSKCATTRPLGTVAHLDCNSHFGQSPIWQSAVDATAAIWRLARYRTTIRVDVTIWMALSQWFLRSPATGACNVPEERRTLLGPGA